MACNVHDVISEMQKCCEANPKFGFKAERDLIENGMLVTLFVKNKPISDRNKVVQPFPYIDYSVGDGECAFYEMAWRLMLMQSFESAT